MIEENAIQEAATKAEEGEYWQRPWYVNGCSSDGRQRRFSFYCGSCDITWLDESDHRLHMMKVHEATHLFRDITEP